MDNLRRDIEVIVLGEKYIIKEVNEDFHERFKYVDAWCDTSSKEIYILKYKRDKDSKVDLEYVRNKIIRHELIHAFIYESGIDTESKWALDEEMIDFFAIQIPKMIEVFEKINII